MHETCSQQAAMASIIEHMAGQKVALKEEFTNAQKHCLKGLLQQLQHGLQ